jgi:hypothetical protein
MPHALGTDELRNDVRFALRFKVGRKQQLSEPKSRFYSNDDDEVRRGQAQMRCGVRWMAR